MMPGDVDGTRGRSGRGRAAALLVVGLVAFAVHANTLVNGFVYDDAKQVLANRWITDARYLGDIFTNDVWGFWPERPASSYYRPLMHILYMAVYRGAGLSPWAYHLMNLLFHTGTSLLAFLVVTRLLERSGNGDSSRAARVAFVAALLFAAHPIHSEAVACVACVPDLSFSFFYLLSFYWYVRSTDLGNLSFLRYGASLFGFVLALLSKEPALTLPLILLAHDGCFRRDRVSVIATRQLPYLFVAVGYLAVRSAVLGGMIGGASGASVSEWLPNAFSVFPRYLEKLLLPIGLNVHHTIPAAESFLELPVLIGLFATAAFAAAALFAWKASGGVFLSLLFLVVPLLPALYIPGIGGVPFGERYLYLPSLGFVILLALAIFEVARRSGQGPAAALFAGILLAAVYSPLAFARNQVWRDDYHLWSDAVSKSPDSDVAHNNLGRAQFDMGRVDGAIEQYQLALALNADYAEAHNNLGAALATSGRPGEAERHFLAALRLKPSYSDAHNNMGILHGRRGDPEDAIPHFRAALRHRPDFPDAHHNLGVAYLETGQVERAIEQFRAALQLNPAAVNTQRSLDRAREMRRLAEEGRRGDPGRSPAIEAGRSDAGP